MLENEKILATCSSSPIGFPVTRELLREGRRRGEVRDDLHPEFLAEMAANLFAGAVNNWLNDSRRPLGERLGRAVVFLQESLRPGPTRGRQSPPERTL